MVLLACAALGAALATAVLCLPGTGGEIARQVQAHLADSGVSHPVTAVLLNFRGYDTLLEIAVLLVAGLGILAGGGLRTPGLRLYGAQGPLQALARRLAPPMVVVAGYLLWAGSHAPGGAFQAAAVLGAAGVLLAVAGIVGTWSAPSMPLRAALTLGFFIFLAIAAAPLRTGALLQYPPDAAGAFILLIEAGLTVSLGLVLAGLFLWQPNEAQRGRQ